MAARKKTSNSKEIVKWDEQLARDAEIAAGMEANTGGGQFFNLQGGILSWQDAPIPGNQMPVVILDTIFENVYYEGKYDPDDPQPPMCYAFAREERELRPHSLVVEGKNQMCGTSGLCEGCEMNEWGSADVGRGKACKNTRRLAIIAAGQFDKFDKMELANENHFENTTVGFMKLPITSVKGYASYVKQVANALKRPPHGIFTKVKVIPDPKTQFKVLFEPIQSIGDELMGIIMKRREEAMSTIDFPYSLPEDEEAKPQRSKKKAAGKGRSRNRY